MAAQGGQRPDYKQRVAQKKRASTVMLFVYAVVIGAGIGLAYIKRAELKSYYDSMMASKPVTPPTIPADKKSEAPKVVDVQPAEPAKKIVEAPVTPPKAIEKPKLVPDSDPKDVVAARKAMADSRNLFEQLQFSEAAKLLEGVEKLKLGSVADEVMTLKKKAIEFGNATKFIPVSDYAQGENAVLVTTVDGNEWRGIKTKETDEQLYLQAVSENNPASEGKQIFPIAKSEIKSIVPLPLKQRQASFAELLVSVEGGVKLTHSSDFFDLVYLSKRLGMGKECLVYLNRAYDGANGIAGDPKLGDNFRGVVVRRSISRASLLMAANRRTQVELELKKLSNALPGYGPAEEEIAAFRSQVMNKVRADFQPSIVLNERKPEMNRAPREPKLTAPRPETKAVPPPREDEIEVSVDNSKIIGSGKAAAIVERANSKFDIGTATFRKYKVGVGGNKEENNRNLLAARALLNEAIDMYEEALKFDSANKAIRDRQQSAQMMIYSCNKNLIL